MAKKRRKKGKRRATKAQLRALKKAHAALRAKRRGKKRKSPKRKARKAGRRKTTRKRSVAHHMRSASRRGFQPHSGGDSVSSHYHSGARGYASGVAASKRRRHKAKGMKRAAKKHGGVVTAASIISGARSHGAKLWVCKGPKRSGCGGGRKGGHVVGVLR